MRIARHVAFVALLPLAVPAAARAQGRMAQLGIEYRSVSFDSGVGAKSVQELAVPIGLVLPLSQRVRVDIGTFFAQARREDDAGQATTISGLTDLTIRALIDIVPDVVVFSLTSNLPTGHATLEGAELDVAGAVASDLIPFPVSNFGSGLSVTSGLAVALPVGSWALGLGGSYRYSGEFQPLADTGLKYQPGGEVRLRAGIDRIVGQGRISLGFTYSNFSTDEFGGSGAYRSGARMIPQFTATVPFGNNQVAFYMWDVYRRAGEYPAAGIIAPRQNTLTTGMQFAFGRGRSVFRPSIEYRKQWEGVDAMADAGSLISLAARYQLPLGTRTSIVPSFRFDTGSVVAGTGDGISLTGFGAGLALSTSW